MLLGRWDSLAGGFPGFARHGHSYKRIVMKMASNQRDFQFTSANSTYSSYLTKLIPYASSVMDVQSELYIRKAVE